MLTVCQDIFFIYLMYICVILHISKFSNKNELILFILFLQVAFFTWWHRLDSLHASHADPPCSSMGRKTIELAPSVDFHGLFPGFVIEAVQQVSTHARMGCVCIKSEAGSLTYLIWQTSMKWLFIWNSYWACSTSKKWRHLCSSVMAKNHGERYSEGRYSDHSMTFLGNTQYLHWKISFL